jgi:hypothetical protein
MRGTTLGMVLLLAACSPPPVEYVLAPPPADSPFTDHSMPATMRGSVRARIHRDTSTGRITLLLRSFRGDSLINSDMTALGGEAGTGCTTFAGTSWTCAAQGERWTLDNNELRLTYDDPTIPALVFRPQPVTTP